MQTWSHTCHIMFMRFGPGAQMIKEIRCEALVLTACKKLGVNANLVHQTENGCIGEMHPGHSDWQNNHVSLALCGANNNALMVDTVKFCSIIR
jgi:hypothetical protein